MSHADGGSDTGPSTFRVDGEPIVYRDGDSALVAMVREGVLPTGGGCLCTQGDCPNCLATVDGVSYVRTCQVAARSGLVVERDHLDGRRPPLPDVPSRSYRLDGDLGEDQEHQGGREVVYRHCDVVVIGLGEAGCEVWDEAVAAGKNVVGFDAGESAEVLGIYPGPVVVARTARGLVHAMPSEEIVVATGAAEVFPTVPGSDLPGVLTRRAAEELSRRGVDLTGDLSLVAIGEVPCDVDAVSVEGELLRFEAGEDGKLAAVVTGQGEVEVRTACRCASVDLGLHPRDALARMAPKDFPVRVVGAAAVVADQSSLPKCSREGVLCPCSGVTGADLEEIWRRGFREMELVKRATLAGTGTCQGSVCLPYLRSFLAEKGGELQAPFTARPMTRQPTFDEMALGTYHHATPRTALDSEHRALGAKMERAGGWFRPWSYGDRDAEYRAVREAVSICDVSTLGKMSVSGPDAMELLERLYPTRVRTLEKGRSRYVLMLDERGYVLDDGLISRESETRYSLTFTSGGATLAELWVRDWAESWGLDVRLLNQTMTLGAINVTGPGAAELLGRAGVLELPPFGAHHRTIVCGVDCRVYRLSFTGELSYELHHPAADSVTLWRALLELGAIPHGLETLLDLRLEKGHIVVGQDTDYDSTPRRIAHEWAVKLDRDHDFVGKRAVQRTKRIELDRRLVGLQMELPEPIEGAVIWSREEEERRHVGCVTSSTASPALKRAVMLGWVDLRGGELPGELEIDGRPAEITKLPFYDPDGVRARVSVEPMAGQEKVWPGPRLRPSPEELTPEEVTGSASSELVAMEWTRVVAEPASLDDLCAQLNSSGGPVVHLRLAPDELLVSGSAGVVPAMLCDRHAIVERETSFSGVWLNENLAGKVLTRTCEWRLPTERPALAQGAVADLPLKIWFAPPNFFVDDSPAEHVLFLVPTPYARDFEERIGHVARRLGGSP